MHHFTIVLPTGHQQFTTEGRYISGANVQTSARTADAARLAVFTLAGERDAAIIRAERWARAGLNHCQPVEPDDLPSAPIAVLVREVVSTPACTRGATRIEDSAMLRMQAQMCAEEGTDDYRAAWQAKMDRYLAAKGAPVVKPAPQPRPFAPVPSDVDRAHEEALQREAEWQRQADEIARNNARREQSLPAPSRRHVLTADDRRKAGRTTASKPAPSGRACPYCRQSSIGFDSHLAFAGHIGFCAFARKYANGDKKLAGEMLSRKGLSVIDPMPRNGAWQRGSDYLAAA
jgi:hypothetical protein